MLEKSTQINVYCTYVHTQKVMLKKKVSASVLASRLSVISFCSPSLPILPKMKDIQMVHESIPWDLGIALFSGFSCVAASLAQPHRNGEWL